jgi:hypothetical protein
MQTFLLASSTNLFTGEDAMSNHRCLVDACRAVGLDCRCEHLHAEPRFRVAIDQSASRPLLYLAIRNDDSIGPHPLHLDPDLPGILFEVTEETVLREPELEVWLPHTELHRYVAWREGGVWKVGKLGERERADTAAGAVNALRHRSDCDPARS